MVSEEQNPDVELASEVVPVPEVPQEVDPQDQDDSHNENMPRKKSSKRHRKKALHHEILKQMEFYFSDANLAKDRFLANILKIEPNIDLEIFLKFNKIRALTTDVNEIVKALEKSKILKVSEDGTKVCRITPVVIKDNVDDCTVYVQRLPPDATHDWLSKLFSEYGPVAYVSIPKFKTKQRIKGFAFVEFETPECAQKCLKAFREKGCELPSQIAPTDVLSISTFSEDAEPKTENNESKKNATSEVECSDNESVSTKEQKVEEVQKLDNKEKKKKRKLTNIEEKSEEIGPKKLKRNESIESDNKDSSTCASDSNTENEEKRHKKRKKRTSSEVVHESDSEPQNIQEEPKNKKKKNKEESLEEVTEEKNNTEEKKEITSEGENNVDVKKPKKNKRKRNQHHHAVKVTEKADEVGLQVMGKKEWKKLRNKYLDLQRAKMRQLKQHFKRAQWSQWGDRNKMETENEETSDYKIEDNKKINPASKLEFSPGLIVKMELDKICTDPKGFKAGLRSKGNNSGSIKYIDISEGSCVAYVRCDSSEAAASFAQENNESKNVILTGDEEKSYWDKIMKDREEKKSIHKVRPKQKGRVKLLKKAEKELGKHIKFDDDLDE